MPRRRSRLLPSVTLPDFRSRWTWPSRTKRSRDCRGRGRSSRRSTESHSRSQRAQAHPEGRRAVPRGGRHRVRPTRPGPSWSDGEVPPKQRMQFQPSTPRGRSPRVDSRIGRSTRRRRSSESGRPDTAVHPRRRDHRVVRWGWCAFGLPPELQETRLEHFPGRLARRPRRCSRRRLSHPPPVAPPAREVRAGAIPPRRESSDDPKTATRGPRHRCADEAAAAWPGAVRAPVVVRGPGLPEFQRWCRPVRVEYRRRSQSRLRHLCHRSTVRCPSRHQFRRPWCRHSRRIAVRAPTADRRRIPDRRRSRGSTESMW